LPKLAFATGGIRAAEEAIFVVPCRKSSRIPGSDVIIWRQWQVRVAEGNPWPRILPLLLIVTGFWVALMQVAMPMLLSDWAAWMLVLTGSEVDHDPLVSGVCGQKPDSFPESENCAWLPGGDAAWSAVAVLGEMLVEIWQVLLPQFNRKKHATITVQIRRNPDWERNGKASTPNRGVTNYPLANRL
jgi:hypothetical protein